MALALLFFCLQLPKKKAKRKHGTDWCIDRLTIKIQKVCHFCSPFVIYCNLFCFSLAVIVLSAGILILIILSIIGRPSSTRDSAVEKACNCNQVVKPWQCWIDKGRFIQQTSKSQRQVQDVWHQTIPARRWQYEGCPVHCCSHWNLFKKDEKVTKRRYCILLFISYRNAVCKVPELASKYNIEGWIRYRKMKPKMAAYECQLAVTLLIRHARTLCEAFTFLHS